MSVEKRYSCGKCHDCGEVLGGILDGEEWCPVCKTYRRYKSHGWGAPGDGEWECPDSCRVREGR